MKQKTETIHILTFSLALLLAVACVAQAQSTNADFQQAVADYRQATDRAASLAAAEKIIKLAAAMDQMPPIPEEARKHFVMGTALFKDAKTPDDYTQVCAEFSQATKNAPWWPEARYNRALAYEAAGKYADAIEQFKLYQSFKLPADEARTVQDKIYVLEAKQEKAAKEVAQRNAEEAKAKTEADAAAARQRQIDDAKNREAAFIKSLDGATYIRNTSDPAGWAMTFKIEIKFRVARYMWRMTSAPKSLPIAGNGNWMDYDKSGVILGKVFVIDDMNGGRFTISDDGQKLTQVRPDGQIFEDWNRR